MTERQKHIVFWLLEHGAIEFNSSQDDVEVACALVNLGIATLTSDNTIILRSREKAQRFLRG